MSAEVANDVTFATKGVAAYSKRALEDGREVASKTGTVGSSEEDNSDAWMVGYTPSLSTSVWMGSDGNDPIVDGRGRIIYGSGLPGAIWQRFMNAALAGSPMEELPDRPSFQGDSGEGVAEPTTEAPPPPPPSSSAPPPPPTPVEQTPVDTDGDGVPDADDPAPRDPTVRTAADLIDNDRDGVPASRDPDDNDPAVPGQGGGTPTIPGTGGGNPGGGNQGGGGGGG
jgi:membrane peptidoglycan carboxypeptidase